MFTFTRRRIGLGSLLLLGFIILYMDGIDGVRHWLGFIADKGGQVIHNALPVSTNVDRLKYELGTIDQLDADLVEEMAGVVVQKRRAEEELIPYKDKLKVKVQEHDYLASRPTPEDWSARKRHDDQIAGLVGQINNLNQLVAAKTETVNHLAETKERLHRARETASQKRDEYLALIAKADSLHMLKKASPPDALNHRSAFGYADGIAKRIRDELEKDRYREEIRKEIGLSNGAAVKVPPAGIVIEHARNLLQ